MRVFKKGNWSKGVVCPICESSKDGEVVLVGVDETQEGYNIHAIQIHLDCIELRITEYNPELRGRLIYQKVINEKE